MKKQVQRPLSDFPSTFPALILILTCFQLFIFFFIKWMGYWSWVRPLKIWQSRRDQGEQCVNIEEDLDTRQNICGKRKNSFLTVGVTETEVSDPNVLSNSLCTEQLIGR